MIIRKIAEEFFFFIDKHIQQKRIFSYLKNQKIKFEGISVDVGAHAGLYTDEILKLNPKIFIILFEPQYNCFKTLKLKYKKNKRIKIYNIALSNKAQYLNMFVNKHDLTTSLNLYTKKKTIFFFIKSLIFNSSTKKMVIKTLKIKTKKLSTILSKKKNKIIDLIKIDTEGHDFNVIKGMGKHINKTKFIIVEFHKKNTFKGYDPNKIHQYLIKNKFVLKKTYRFPLLNFEDRIYKRNA